MAAAVRSRSEFDGAALRKLARASPDAKQVRRLLALAAIHQGGTRGEAARLGRVTLQIVRDWVMRFNAKRPARLVDRKPPGCHPMLGDDQRRALAEIVQAGPVPAAHGVVRWRSTDLAQWAWDEAGVGRVRARLPRSTAIELWWQDEAPVGQKNGITPLGTTWNTTIGAARPAHRVRLQVPAPVDDGRRAAPRRTLA